MTGPHDSVIGSDEHNAIKRFVTGMPTRLEPATGDVRIEGALVECDADGRATVVRRPSASKSTSRLERGARRRRSEHGEQRDEHDVAREHDPGEVEASRVVQVAPREPHLGQHERQRQQPVAASPRRPRTSGTSGTSQIRYCGDSTLPKATNAHTQRPRSAASRVARRRPARERDPERDERRDLRAATNSGGDRAVPADVLRAVRVDRRAGGRTS